MIHFEALEAAAAAPLPGGELVARIAGLRRALRLLEPGGCGPSCDAEEFAAVEFASEPVRRCFDARSERVIGAAAAGLEAVVGVRASGRDANQAAVGCVADAIREGLWDLARLAHR
jgi:hypothetical protein